MNSTIELFAQLTCEFEDLHSLAAEGQADSQPAEMLLILSTQISTRLQICRKVVGRINDALGLS